MFQPTRLVTTVLALLITAGSAGISSKDMPVAKPEDVGLSGERLARMTKAIHDYVDEGRTPGVVTLIARHGKVVHLDAYGKADLASGRQTRTDDIFRMYSMTKPIRVEHLQPTVDWWGGRERQGRTETEVAWRVTMDDIKARDYNLDIKNPHVVADDHGEPEELLAKLDEAEREAARLRDQLKAILEEALLR